jgi:protein involved in temperature-dependent protein secretion
MLAHARVRQGQFPSALLALRALARLAPHRRELANDIASMCEREIEARHEEHRSAWRIAAAVFAFAFGSSREVKGRGHADPWSGFRADEPAAGQAVLTSGAALDFDDLRDADDGLGRRLLVYGAQRAWKVPFESILSIALHAGDEMMGFDDIWVPVQIELKTAQSTEPIRGRIPCLYSGSLESKDGEVAAGAITLFSYLGGRRSGLGQRDYAISRGGSITLVGVRQLRLVTFK